MPKTRGVNTVELSELTTAVLSGQLKKFPKVLNLNLEKATDADYQALLQLVRYRSFGHRVLPSEPQQSDLQKIRALINEGRFREARELARTQNQNDPEVRVEIARVGVFLGNFGDVPDLLSVVTDDPGIPASTRGVAYQLIGHAQMELGNLSEAAHCIESAQLLARTSGNDMGHIAASLFLSRIHAFRTEFREAHHWLAQAHEGIAKLGSFRWLLGYYRHLSHACFLGSDPRCMAAAYAGILLARSIKDELFEYRGIVEITLMGRKFGASQASAAIIRKMKTHASRSESDLARWCDAVFDGAQPHSFSAERFVKESRVSSAKPAPALPKPDEALFWIFDRQTHTFIDLKSSEFVSIPPESPHEKLLSSLHRAPGGLPTPELFEKVWNLRWSQERHQNVMDVTLHRFNKSSKTLKILRENGKMRLSCAGLVL